MSLRHLSTVKSEENLVYISTESSDDPWLKPKRSRSLTGLSSGQTSAITAGTIYLRNQEIPYMLAEATVQVDDVMSMISKKWSIEKPCAVLMIVSDLLPLVELRKRNTLERLVQGIAHASANVQDLWIITGGINVGLSKEIGQAMHVEKNHRQSKFSQRSDKLDYWRSPVIGICRDDLLSYSDSLRFPRNNCVKLENRDICRTEDGYELNPYHSHYILVKDLSIPKTGIENFLLRFEKALSMGCQEYHDGCRVPVIALLAQGDALCVHYILEHLKRALPVVIIKGSGGLADILATAYYEVNRRYQKYDDPEVVDNGIKPNLIRRICFTFHNLQNNSIVRDYVCDRILECIRVSKSQTGADYIHVVDAYNDLKCPKDLTEHLLKTLFLSQRKGIAKMATQPRKDLLLTIQWNCSSVAMSEVFLMYPKFEVENSVFEAVLIMKERESFVSLFLQRKFHVHRFLSSSQLLALFGKSLNEPFFYEVCWRGILDHTEKTEPLTVSFLDYDLNFVIETLTDISLYVCAEELDLNAIGMFTCMHKKKHDKASAEQQALAILVVWALLSFRLNLAKEIWRHSGLPVTIALTSSLILERLLTYTSDGYYQEEMNKARREFSDTATGVFALVYDSMPCRALDRLGQKNYVWEEHTLLDTARLSGDKKFVSLPSCQKLITHIFLGNIKLRNTNWGYISVPTAVKIILSALLIFPMYFWVTFVTPVKETQEGSEMEEIERSEVSKNDDDYRSCKTKASKSMSSSEYPCLTDRLFWMWTAPITKFWIFHTFYFLFLALFSLAVLFPSCGHPLLDKIVCFWIFSIIIENIYTTYKCIKIHSETSIFLKATEITFMSLFLWSYVYSRLIYIELDAYLAKILLCLGLLFFYYRMIYCYLLISPTLGPMLFTLKEMITKDFRNFVYLTILLMIANAFVMQVVIYPDYALNPDFFRLALIRAWITLFLSPTEEYEELPKRCGAWQLKNKSRCETGDYHDYSCPTLGILPHIFGIQYFILLKFVLWTLLFAMFSFRNEVSQERSLLSWKFIRYHVVMEYRSHSPLPPPLNFLYYFFCFLRFILGAIKRKVLKASRKGTERGDPITDGYYNYWRAMSEKYAENQNFMKNEEAYGAEKLNLIMNFNEKLKYLRKSILHGKSQIAEVNADILHTSLCVRTANRYKHKKYSVDIDLHFLSRHSPYPDTEVDRIPVADKYVPWDVSWLTYTPETYNLPKSEFSSHLQKFVDEFPRKTDERSKDSPPPAIRWNMEYTDSQGLYHGRDSWITDFHGDSLIYRLQKGLPQNPSGRTGLRGRGALPSFGPNHYIFVIVTRWKDTKRSQLQLIETWQGRRNELSLPGAYVTNENRYSVLQHIFRPLKVKEIWQNEDELIKYFQAHAGPASESKEEEAVQCRMLFRNYMDDRLNTDQAWKEVEVWHVHYNVPLIRDLCSKPRMAWRLIAEEVFTLLPCEQVTFLERAIASRYSRIS